MADPLSKSVYQVVSGARLCRRGYRRLLWFVLFSVIYMLVLRESDGYALVISSISFSSRMEDDYAPNTWKTRWILLDGWLAILYLLVFSAIAFLWRPSANNKRLAMSDELATDENDDEYFEVDTLTREELDDEEAARGGPEEDKRFAASTRLPGDLGDDSVVFDIGAEGSEDEDEETTAFNPRRGGTKGQEKTEDLETGRKSPYDGPPPYKQRSD
jgi:flagellar biosynthesis/type III secretory pathway M-ring protein FliF/YscJ